MIMQFFFQNSVYCLKHFDHGTGLHFLKFRCSRKFSTGKTRKVLLHLFSNRIFRKLVNGKQLVTSLRLSIIILCRSLIFFGLSGVAIVNDHFVTKSGKKK